MFNTKIRRSTLAAAVLIPAFILITPALASAAGPANPSDPGAGQNYSNSQTTTDSNGVHTSKVSSDMGPDGKVNYRRSDSSANANGRTESNTYSGAMNDPVNPAGGPTGQDYRNTQTTTDANGTRSTTVDSTTAPDGKANYSRHSETANANGRTESTTDSGAMNPAPAAMPANPMSNPAGRTIGAGGAPLIIINTPGAPTGM